MKFQAHRGVSSEYPENTIAAFEAAVKQGYDIIEADIKYTLDGHLIVMHDQTVNRTGRTAEGEAFTLPTRINEMTLAELRALEYGAWMAPRFKGEPLPLLDDLLDFAERTQIPFKIDNCWERFPEEMQEKLLHKIAERADKMNIGITCAKVEDIARVTALMPTAAIHYDGIDLSEECLQQVVNLSEGHHLTIWVCYDNKLTKSFKGERASAELCERVKKYGECGLWILYRQEEMEDAVAFGVDVIETTGHIKPDAVSK